MARITIDYTPAVQQSAGIGRLTREVVRALLGLDTTHQFRLFCMGGIDERHKAQAAGPLRRDISWVTTPLDDRWMYRIWHRARVPIPVQFFAGRCDLYHATDFVL